MPNYTPDPDKQPQLLPEDHSISQTTPEEQKEKERYRECLHDYLRDPELSKIEGFPIGEDEDILTLYGPPYLYRLPQPLFERGHRGVAAGAR